MLLLALLVAVAQAVCLPAQQLALTAADQEVLDVLNTLTNQPETLKECVYAFFQRGYYSPLLQVLNEGENTELANSLTNAIGNRLSRINGFIELLDMPTSNLEPFVKWAQNSSHVFVSFKLSHRADSPPCVNVKQQRSLVRDVAKAVGMEIESNSTIVNDTGVDQPQAPIPKQPEFIHSCECIVSHQRVFFRLQIKFWKSLEELQLKKEGAGTLTLIGKKSEAEVWRYLDANKRRWAVWDEIRQKYESDMKKFFEMIEQEEDQEVKGRKKNRRKKFVLDPDTPTPPSPSSSKLGTATLPPEL